MLQIEIGNTSTARLSNVTEAGVPVEDLLARITLLDRAGVEVEGQGWPAQMLHIGDGNYEATLESGLQLECGRPYQAIVTGSSGDAVLSIKAWATAVVRDG